MLAPQPTNVSLGSNVLGEIFGSKDVSRTVAQNAASKSGFDPSTLKKMLPMLAMLVAGYMAKQRGSAQPSAAGGLGGLLGSLNGQHPGDAGALQGRVRRHRAQRPLPDEEGERSPPDFPERPSSVSCKLAVHGNAMASPAYRKCLFVHCMYTKQGLLSKDLTR